MRIQKFEKLENINRLANIIFLNFIELEKEENIVFNIDDIKSTLSSSGLLGWFILDNSDKIIGYIVGELKDLTDGRYVYYISYFYVIHQYRNQGLGAQLLLHCISYVKSINVPFVMLISKLNSKAFKLYQSIGFGFDPIIKINNKNYSVLVYYC